MDRALTAMSSRALAALPGAVILGLGVGACGPSARPARPRPPGPPPTVALAPLELSVRAASPTRGLVLAAGGEGRAGLVHLVPGPSSAAVLVPSRGQKPGSGRVWVTIGPPEAQATGAPHATPAGLSGAPAAGVRPAPGTAPPASAAPPPDDPAWMRAAWQAQSSAALALGKRPEQVRASLVVSPAGATLSPPTGAALAGATVCALTGKAPVTGAVVLARLDPDGSLAPVADRAGAVDRALAGGARRLVLPPGGAVARARGGGTIDLIKRAGERGATVAMARNLAQVVEGLGCGPLPQARAVPPSAMALTSRQQEALSAVYRRQLDPLARAWPRLVEEENRAGLPAPLTSLLESATQAARRGEHLRAAGQPAAAYVEMARATAAAEAAAALDQILLRVADGDLDKAGARLTEATATDPTTPASAALPEGTTVGHHLAELARAAAHAAHQAWAGRTAAALEPARQALAGLAGQPKGVLASRETARALAQALTPALLSAARARQEADASIDRLGLEDPGGPALMLDPETAAGLAEFETRGAESGLAVLPAPGEGAATSRDQSLGALLVASAPAHASDDPEARLAAAWLAEALVGRAVARTRALGPRLDPWTGQILAVGHPGSLRPAIDTAERQARVNAAIARAAVGRIPAAARLAYQAAAALAHGDVQEQTLALDLYRTASDEARLALLLALSASPVPSAAPPADSAPTSRPPRPGPASSPAVPAPPPP